MSLSIFDALPIHPTSFIRLFNQIVKIREKEKKDRETQQRAVIAIIINRKGGKPDDPTPA